MKKFAVAVLMLTVAAPAFAKTHKDDYPVPCAKLWVAVKDTLRNSGKYGIIGTDNTEMTASFSIGLGSIGQKRINSVLLNAKGDGACEMVVQSGFSGLTNDDAGDFKRRVDKSLSAQPQAAPAAKPESSDK